MGSLRQASRLALEAQTQHRPGQQGSKLSRCVLRWLWVAAWAVNGYGGTDDTSVVEAHKQCALCTCCPRARSHHGILSAYACPSCLHKAVFACCERPLGSHWCLVNGHVCVYWLLSHVRSRGSSLAPDKHPRFGSALQADCSGRPPPKRAVNGNVADFSASMVAWLSASGLCVLYSSVALQEQGTSIAGWPAPYVGMQLWSTALAEVFWMHNVAISTGDNALVFAEAELTESWLLLTQLAVKPVNYGGVTMFSSDFGSGPAGPAQQSQHKYLVAGALPFAASTCFVALHCMPQHPCAS